MKPFVIDITLPVSGMSCAACAISAESMLKSQPGVISASVNYAAKSVKLVYQPEVTGLDELQRNLSSIGYDLIADPVDKLATFERMEQAKLNLLRRKLIIAALFSTPIFVLSMLVHHPPLWMQFLFLALSIPVIFYSGISFYTTTWNLALRKQTSMDTLVALGTGAALAISLANTVFPDYFTANGLSSHVYYESAVVIITLILLGRFLEDRSRNKASAAIKSLMNLQPETVIIISGGKEEIIALKNINPGDIILVKPGNTIPVDGVVLEGNSWVEESMMSGEPLPVFKQGGDKVLSGTGNQKGALTIETLKTGKETVLSRIIAMVEEAQSSKAPVQQLVDRISAVFVPVVIVIAVLTFISWLILGPEPSLTYAIVTSISVLVIACPCALGLATPTALIVAIGRGASKGILFRNASGLESAGKTDVLVIDKTGTLTTGKPAVEKMINFDDNEQNLLVFAGLSRLSEHPLSQALSKYLLDKGVEAAKIENFADIPGKGMSGWHNQLQYFAGSLSLLESQGVIINSTDSQLIKEMEEGAYSLILLATPDTLLAAAAISDKVRESAASAVAELKSMKIEVIMLTGDHGVSAKQIATQVGIEVFESGLSPEDKATNIRKLQTDGRHVAMAGDGINDTIALAAADTGIAMGSGSDASIETAAITITGSNLHQIVEAIRLSRKTNRIIRQNLFWAFFYNVLMLPLAAGLFFSFTHQLLNPMIASAAMALSSVTVVANSLRIRNS